MKKIYLTICALLFSMISFAALQYNTTLTESVFNNSKSSEVGKVDWKDGIRLGYQTSIWVQMPGDWDEKSVVVDLDPNKVAYQLTFKLHCQWADLTDISTATKTDFKVLESPDKSNWEEAFSGNYGAKTESETFTANLKKTTKYLKFFYSGNYAGIFSAVKVTNQTYSHALSSSVIDFGSKPLGADDQTESVSFEWCDVNTYTVSQLHPEHFAVSTSNMGAKATFGNANISVTYSHNVLGEHRDTLTISNGSDTKTVYIVGITDRRQQSIIWNEALSSTGFVMAAGEVLPSAQVQQIAFGTSGGEVTYESDNTGVISVSLDGKTLTALSNGIATITARQAGDAQFLPAADSKLFTVTSAAKQSIIWNQPLVGLTLGSGEIYLDAYATSGGDITYYSDNEGVVSVSGNVLTIVGAGETYVTATQEGSSEYAPVSMSLLVVVADPNGSCDEMALYQPSLELEASSQEYTLNGAPTTLSFDAYHDTKSGSWGQLSYSALIVEEYSTRNGVTEWYTVFNQEVNESSAQSYNVSTLSENATKIRFRTGESATTHITNIRIPRKRIFSASLTEITDVAECSSVYTKTITINHQNIDRLVATVPAPFSLDKNLIGQGCADVAADQLTLSLLPTEKGVYDGEIYITDGKSTPHELIIPVSISVVGLSQIIQDWTLNDSYTGLDSPIALNAVASSELPVEYSSSDESVARIENGQLIAVAPGTVTITASQPGNDRFEPAAEQQKTVTINYADAVITAAPTVNAINYGETLSEAVLAGGEANVAGSFRWELPAETVLLVGEHTLNVIFDAANPALFDADTIQLTLTVRPAITYGEQMLTICAGDSVEYHGVWYKEALTTQVTILNVAGGDSIIDLTVAVNPVFTTPISAVICSGEHYDFAGEQLTGKGVYYDTLQTIYGCDSVIVLDLEIADKYLITETYTMFVGQPESWRGKDLSIYGVGEHVVYDSLKTIVYDCDSVFKLTLTVNVLPTSYEEQTEVVCPGDSVEYDGLYYKAGVHEILYHNIYGGDSVINLTVNELPTYFTEESRTQYVGKSGQWRGKDLSVYGVGEHVVYDSLKTLVFDCDSVFALNLTIEALPTSESEINAKVCPGDSIEYDGRYFGAGIHTLHYLNTLGGDSIVKLIISLYPTYENANGLEILEIYEHAEGQ